MISTSSLKNQIPSSKFVCALTLYSALSLAIIAPSNAALTTNLELYYDFESDDQTSGGIHDQSGNNRHGSAIDVSGGSVNYIFDTDTPTLNSIKSIRADGTDEILADILGYDGVTGTASRTVAAWVKVDPNVADNVNMHIFEWGIDSDANGTRWTLRREHATSGTNDQGAIRVEVDGSYRRGDVDSGSLNDDLWHHVAAVYDNTLGGTDLFVTLFFDGVEYASYNQGGGATIDTTVNNTVRIGGSSNVNVREWNGWLDEVGIWSRPLDSTEIEQLANGATIPEPSGVTMLLLGTASLLGARRRIR